jgi:hypothetical protein
MIERGGGRGVDAVCMGMAQAAPPPSFREGGWDQGAHRVRAGMAQGGFFSGFCPLQNNL